METPKQKTVTISKDEETVISPNGETTADRYAKVKEREANMTNEERLQELREGAKRFNELLVDLYDEDESDGEG